MAENNIIHVNSYIRNGHRVSAHTRGSGISLQGILSSSSPADGDDILAVKEALMGLGYYEPDPKIGLDKFTDDRLFASIKSFQEDNGLYADARIKPGGETERALNIKISDREKAFSDPNWGKKTEKKLNKYMENYQYPERSSYNIGAPIEDMYRNHNDLKKLGLEGADKFFHCKGNYEAAKRGKWGRVVGKAMSFGKEVLDMPRYGMQDSLDDWEANRQGWRGAKKGKSLLESCPRNPRHYFK